MISTSIINISGKEARQLIFELITKQADSHIALSPELRNLAQIAGISYETFNAIFQMIQQTQNIQQKYNFSLIIYNDEYIDLGINCDVGRISDFKFDGGKISINLEQ